MQEIGKFSDSKFFDRDVQEVSKDLLGRVLEHLVDGIWLSVRIIETEAYYGQGNLLKGIESWSDPLCGTRELKSLGQQDFPSLKLTK